MNYKLEKEDLMCEMKWEQVSDMKVKVNDLKTQDL